MVSGKQTGKISFHQSDLIVEKKEDSENGKISPAVIGFGILFVIVFFGVLLYGGLRSVKFANRLDLSKRFVRHNEVIKQKAGGIKYLNGFGQVKGLAQWETSGTVVGEANNIEVTVVGWCGNDVSDKTPCTISKAKYRKAGDAGADWH